MFASLEDGEHIDNSVMVLGYVIMRVPMIFQWARAARQDPERRPVAEGFIATLVISQAAWVVLAPQRHHHGGDVLLGGSVDPGRAGRSATSPSRSGAAPPGTPTTSRSATDCFVIIALGEGLLGTTVALGAVIGPEGPGWSDELVLLGLAGTAMTFGMWWIYFVMPSGPLLHAHRERSFGWGYGHIPLFGATVAVGAGLHVAAYYIEHDTHLSAVGMLATVAIPLAVYVLMIYLLYMQISRTYDPFHLLLLALSAVVLGGSMLLAAAGVDVFWCLLLLAATPWVTVVGYETIGHRHNQDVLDSLAE